MKILLSNFTISYCGQEIGVSRKASAGSNDFIVHLREEDVRLKAEGINKILWLEKGKGATALAYELGQLIEANINTE